MKSITWLALTGAMSLMMACGGGVSDDDMIKDLDDDQVEDMCSDACADASTYTLTCDQGGVMAEIEGGSTPSTCETNCLKFKAATDSCTATAGDFRATVNNPSSCDELEASLSAAAKFSMCL